jgi:hypothetical protein
MIIFALLLIFLAIIFPGAMRNIVIGAFFLIVIAILRANQ